MKANIYRNKYIMLRKTSSSFFDFFFFLAFLFLNSLMALLRSQSGSPHSGSSQLPQDSNDSFAFGLGVCGFTHKLFFVRRLVSILQYVLINFFKCNKNDLGVKRSFFVYVLACFFETYNFIIM